MGDFTRQALLPFHCYWEKWNRPSHKSENTCKSNKIFPIFFVSHSSACLKLYNWSTSCKEILGWVFIYETGKCLSCWQEILGVPVTGHCLCGGRRALWGTLPSWRLLQPQRASGHTWVTRPQVTYKGIGKCIFPEGQGGKQKVLIKSMALSLVSRIQWTYFITVRKKAEHWFWHR